MNFCQKTLGWVEKIHHMSRDSLTKLKTISKKLLCSPCASSKLNYEFD
jgi:hypothetical protein